MLSIYSDYTVHNMLNIFSCNRKIFQIIDVSFQVASDETFLRDVETEKHPVGKTVAPFFCLRLYLLCFLVSCSSLKIKRGAWQLDLGEKHRCWSDKFC